MKQFVAKVLLKFKTSLLWDSDYINLVKKVIKNAIEKYTTLNQSNENKIDNIKPNIMGNDKVRYQIK